MVVKNTTTTYPVSNQQFHDLHTLDIGRHAADRASSLLDTKLTFDPNSRKKKKKKQN